MFERAEGRVICFFKITDRVGCKNNFTGRRLKLNSIELTELRVYNKIERYFLEVILRLHIRLQNTGDITILTLIFNKLLTYFFRYKDVNESCDKREFQ